MGNTSCNESSSYLERSFIAFGLMIGLFISPLAWSVDGVVIPAVGTSRGGLAVNPFEDPRLKRWSADFFAGRKDAVAKAVANDLATASPHPLAVQVWLRVQESLGVSREQAVSLAPAAARDKVDAVANIEILSEAGRYDELLRRYPVADLDRYEDLWTVNTLISAAEEANRLDIAFAYRMALLQHYPEQFGPVWNFIDLFSAKNLAEERQEAVTAADRLSGTRGGPVVARIALDRALEELDYVTFAQSWNDTTDWHALRYQSASAYNNQRWTESIELQRRAEASFPFRNAGVRMAKAMIRAGKMNEARQLISRNSLRYAPSGAAAERRAAIDLAEALGEAGESGEQRIVLDKALGRWPDDKDLLEPKAELEQNSGRPAEAVVLWRRLLLKRPQYPYAWSRLVKVYQANGELQQALDAYQEAKSVTGAVTNALFNNMLEVQQQLGEHEAVVRAIKERAASIPLDAWTLNNLVLSLQKLGRKQEALDELRRAIMSRGVTAWIVDRYFELVDDVYGAKGSEAEIQRLRKEFPYPSLIADRLENRLQQRSSSGRQAIVQMADDSLVLSPQSWWPYYYRAWESANAGNYDEMNAVMARGLTTMPTDQPWRRAKLLLLRAELAAKIEKARQTANGAHLQAALADLEEAEKSGISLGDIHHRRFEILSLLNRGEDAARELIAWSAAKPDDKEAVQTLFAFHDSSIGAHSFLALDRYVQRNPYDGNRLALGLEYHAKWGGSPVVALSYSRLLEERAPAAARDGSVIFNKQTAYSQLGDYQTFYEKSYDGATSVATSDRYVSWFETARRKAQSDRSFLLPEKLDLVNMRATIVGPTGIEVERGYHPITGRLTFLRVGTATVSAAYDRRGINLLCLSDSGGSEIRLEYDDADRATRISAKGGDDLSFKYNAMGKPILITVKGVGDIQTEYDETGEISSVHSSGGAKIALRVTSAMQQMLALTRSFARVQSDEVPDLSVKDPVFDKLEKAEMQVRGGALLKAQLATAKWLASHLRDRRSYADDAQSRLAFILEATQVPGATSGQIMMGLEAAALWQQVKLVLHPHGIAEEDWQYWVALKDWVSGISAETPAIKTKLAQVRARFVQEPLRLMDMAHWLPRSYIDNVGYWQRHKMYNVFPRELAERTYAEAILVRRNGDVVVGSGVGLSVLRRGYWEWFGWDTQRQRFTPDLSYDAASRAPVVLSLTEDSSGALWVGTDNGLVRVGDDYTAAAARWSFPAARIEHVAPYHDGVLAGTIGGLRFFNQAGAGKLPTALAAQESSRITLLKSQEAADGKAVLLIGTESALYGLAGDNVQPLANQGMRDAAWFDGRLFMLRNNDVNVASWSGNGKPGSAETIADAGGIHFSRQIEGLALIPIDDGSKALAVLTDMGLSIFRNEHFEEKKLPLADRDVGVLLLASAAGKTFMATTDGIYALEHGKVAGDSAGRVYDLLTDSNQKVTFVARGNRLEAVSHNDPQTGARLFSDISATHLALDAQGGLIANDGTVIVRFAAGTDTPAELFDAKAPSEGGGASTTIGSLLVASDGTIWVTVGASVFRHKDGQTSEFSMFKDPEAFPARSDMISKVVETVDKRIWVVASKESHRYFRGQSMIGGLLEWNGKSFDRKPELFDGSWFISSYTATGPDSAIVGTAYGFARQNAQRFDLFASLNDATYGELKKRQPMLFLGSRGSRLGEDLWLFGTAGGVVAWRNGRWIFPSRLNWLLPDDHLAKYGSRMVHAVATDPSGRIYAGTDRGLMIYESGGSDPMQFLLTENLSEMALGEVERDKLKAEAQPLLAGLPADSAAGRLVQQYNDGNARIAALKSQREQPSSLLAANESKQAASKAQPAEPVAAAGLDQELERREKAQRDLLARLERDSYGLYQMLELKPIDLEAWHKRLAPEDVVIQYIPTADRLIIHIVSSRSIELREVAIKSDELMVRSKAVSAVIAKEAARLRNDRGFARVVEGDDLVTSELMSRGSEGLTQELHWLYEQLLRPVEHDLVGFRHIYIAPVGALAHLPFAALVRSEKPRIEYAAERMDIGVLPSLYLLDLVLRAHESNPSGATIFGNPDGTLPGAQREAETIRGIVGNDSVVRIGAEASIQALQEGAPKARWLHLATHGHLNAQEPAKSFLILAGGVRLSMVDASLLPLEHTEMVVLSACESGVGANGLDYATLARSFSQAGAPSVVASLWLVNDDATARLMEGFYRHRKNGKDVFAALSSAQRDMIHSGGAFAAPAAWSGFLAFGRP